MPKGNRHRAHILLHLVISKSRFASPADELKTRTNLIRSEKGTLNNRSVLSSLVANLNGAMNYLAVAVVLAGAMTMAPGAAAQDMVLTVQLNNPVTLASAHTGDAIAAQVTTPDALRGDTIQGKVTRVSTAGGQAVLQFTFDSLAHSGMLVPVTAMIQGAANSKGQPGLDDQGHALLTSNIAAKAPAQAKRSRIGSQLGGLHRRQGRPSYQ